jgi:hypothetical protein
MTSPASSQPEQPVAVQPVATRNSLLTFLAYIGVLIAAYYVARRTVGIIPALILVYLLYAYRDDVGSSITELMHRGRT